MIYVSEALYPVKDHSCFAKQGLYPGQGHERTQTAWAPAGMGASKASRQTS